MLLQSNENVDGITIENSVVKNSYRGTVATDEGPFSFPTAAGIDKHHILCTQHKRQAIPSATAGLGSNANQAMRDLNALIFKYTSQAELDGKFDEYRQTYAQNAPTIKLLDSLEENKKMLCRAYTQDVYTYNHTTTQRGEGFNDRLKGHGTLKDKLSDASLHTAVNRLDAVVHDTFDKSLEILKTVRLNNARAPCYKEETLKSLQQSVLTVKSCVRVDGSMSKYTCTRTNGDKFNVDLATKIVHRGAIFEIPTCNCGYFQSCFRLCRDIVQALVRVLSEELDRNVTVDDLLVAKYIHPLHLVQLHPIWPQALRSVNRTNYSDLKQVDEILGQSNAAASQQQTSTSSEANTNGAACPEKFYVFKEKKMKVPPLHKSRHGKLNERFKKLGELAVNKGNAETFQHCHARLLQCEKEIMDMIANMTGGVKPLELHDQTPLPPQPRASNKSERRKNDGTNNSRLSASSSSKGAATTSRARSSTKQSTRSVQQNNKNNCSQCAMINDMLNLNVATDHPIDECPRDDLFTKFVLAGAGAAAKSEEGANEKAV